MLKADLHLGHHVEPCMDTNYASDKLCMSMMEAYAIFGAMSISLLGLLVVFLFVAWRHWEQRTYGRWPLSLTNSGIPFERLKTAQPAATNDKSQKSAIVNIDRQESFLQRRNSAIKAAIMRKYGRLAQRSEAERLRSADSGDGRQVHFAKAPFVVGIRSSQSDSISTNSSILAAAHPPQPSAIRFELDEESCDVVLERFRIQRANVDEERLRVGVDERRHIVVERESERRRQSWALCPHCQRFVPTGGIRLETHVQMAHGIHPRVFRRRPSHVEAFPNLFS